MSTDDHTTNEGETLSDLLDQAEDQIVEKPLQETTKESTTTEEDHRVPVAVGHANDGSKVVMDFGERPIKWLELSPKEAFQISMSLRKHARYCNRVLHPKRKQRQRAKR